MICCWMRSIAHRAVLTAMVSLLLVIIVGAALAAAFVGQAVKVLGDVRITRDGTDITVGPGTALQLGDLIKTGAGARMRMRFVDGSILTLGENTQLSIDVFAIDGTNKSRTVILTLLGGIVNAAAAKSGEDKFDYQIKTANAYSAVRGTKWIVDAPKGSTGVYVLNGQVEVGAATAQPVLVPAGSWASVDAQGKLSPVAPTTPAMLQPLLDATSDNGGAASPPPTTPTTPPVQLPSNPIPDETPDYQRALKNRDKKDDQNPNHDKR